jgi:single stranded DNA-binding protein
MNMVILSGNIGAEPELTNYDAGNRRVSFSVACDQYTKDGERTETFWILCYAWDSVCDRLLRCRQNTKLAGRKINLSGSLVQSIWADQENGKKQSKLFVNVQMFELLNTTRQQPSRLSDNSEQQSDAERIFDGKPLYSPRQRSTGWRGKPR